MPENEKNADIENWRNGLLLPLRMYFHPLAVIREYTLPAHSTAHQEIAYRLFIHYLIALLWLPLAWVITWLFLPRITPDLLIIPAAWLTIFLKTFDHLPRPFSYRPPEQMVFNMALLLGGGVMAGILGVIAAQDNGELMRTIRHNSMSGILFVALTTPGIALGYAFSMTVIPASARVVWWFRRINLAGIPAIAASLLIIPWEFTFILIVTWLTFTHLLFLPLYSLITAINGILVQRNPALCKRLWQISPLHRDEYIFLPLPGQVNLLVALYEHYPENGKAALAYLSQNPLRQNLVRKVQQQLHRNTEQ